MYPLLAGIRRVSRAIAVAGQAREEGLAQDERPADMERMIAVQMYDPTTVTRARDCGTDIS